MAAQIFKSLLKTARRFNARENGAILVEFALVLPLMLLFFAVMVESARLFWTYQTAISGVRDAGRYLAKIAPVDICLNGGNLTSYNPTLKNIVENDISGGSLLVPLVSLNSVTTSLTCVAGTYRISPAPVATVTANVTVQFPFGAVFGLFGNSFTSVTTNISDQVRVFGQ